MVGGLGLTNQWVYIVGRVVRWMGEFQSPRTLISSSSRYPDAVGRSSAIFSALTNLFSCLATCSGGSASTADHDRHPVVQLWVLVGPTASEWMLNCRREDSDEPVPAHRVCSRRGRKAYDGSSSNYNTTLEQIAASAGISRRSFFRYFGAKEDIVLGDVAALGQKVRIALAARPLEEGAWTALRAAFLSLRDPDATSQASTRAELAVAKMYHDAPSLRARHLEKHLSWQELLAPDIERRLGVAGGPTPDLRARAVIAAALACLDIAVDAWRASDGTADVVQLFDEVVAAVRL